MYICTTFSLSIYLSVNTSFISVSWLFEWGCSGHRGAGTSLRVNLFPLDIYVQVGLLDHIAVLFSIFWGTSVLFSKIVIPIYIPISSTQRVPFLHILANMLLFVFFLMTVILTGFRYHLVVLICISLMISHTQLFFRD